MTKSHLKYIVLRLFYLLKDPSKVGENSGHIYICLGNPNINFIVQTVKSLLII